MSTQTDIETSKWFKKGLAAQDSGMTELAITAYSTALQLTPNHFESTFNLALIYLEAGKLDRAQQLLISAIKHKPDSDSAYRVLGDILFTKQETEAAQAIYQQAVKINPNLTKAWYNLALVEKHLNRLPAALCSLQNAIRLQPDYSLALTAFAETALQTDSNSDAEIFLKELIKKHPRNPLLQITLAEILFNDQQLDKALHYTLETLKIDPHNGEAYNLTGLINLQLGEAGNARTNLARAHKLSPESKKINSNLLYSLIADPEIGTQEYLEEAKQWWRTFGAPLAAEKIYSHKRNLISNRTLRLAFISGDFYRHSVSYFLLPLIRALAKNQFEIFCYSDTYKTDNYTAEIKKQTYHWDSIYGLDDSTVAKMINNDKIDILIELAGHTANNRLSVMARRPAPVQLSWLGYPASTGISNSIFRLTDQISDPASSEKHYTETLAFLKPIFICYAPPPEAVSLTNKKTELKNNQIVFASFNNSAKLNLQVIEVWAKILEQLPESVLTLKTRTLLDKTAAASIKQKFSNTGINPARILIYGNHYPTIEHFKAYNEVDIALDTFPYNGTTTTCDALWMGIPVITLQGDSHAGRVGVSLLQTIGCPELIAEDKTDYINRAVKLALDSDRLSNYHRNIRNLMQNSPLMDSAGFAKNFTLTLNEIWGKWRDSRLSILQRLALEKGKQLNLPTELATILPDNDPARVLLEQAAFDNQRIYPFLKLGQQYNNDNLPAEAYHCFREELENNPGNHTARYALALTMKELGQEDEAACHFQKVLEANPELIDATVKLSAILTRQNQPEKALQILLAAHQQVPDNNTVNFQLASAYYQLKQLRKAYDTLLLCLELKPEQAGLWNNLGYLMAESGKAEEATDCFHKALSIDPDCIEAQTSLIWHLTQACDWPELHLQVNNSSYLVPLLSLILFPDPKKNFPHAQQAISKSIKESKKMSHPSRIILQKQSIIKIGYLSSDFRDHPVAHNMINLFKLHNRDRFHISAYSCGRDDKSSYREQIRQDCDNFVDLSKLSDRAGAERINEDGIDIMVELMGHTRENRLGICAFRPSPIQISYLGYPGTTGAPFIDYIIADKIVIPISDHPFYSEKVIYLPDCFMIADQAPIAPQPKRSDCGLPETGFIFCSFNSPFKIEPVMFKIWMEILTAVPESCIWLRGENNRYRENLKQYAQKYGIAEKRLIFAPRVARKQDHLARLQLADIALDTRIYNGHTTTLDALWAGVPVLTSRGSHFASRVSDSNLSAIGLPEMITPDLESYKITAIELARNPDKLTKLRQTLEKNRLSTPLFNTEATAKNLEKAYLESWQRYISGKEIASFEVK